MVECCDTSLLRVSAKLWSSYAESHIERAGERSNNNKNQFTVFGCLLLQSWFTVQLAQYFASNSFNSIYNQLHTTSNWLAMFHVPCSFYVNLHNLWFLFRIVASVETIKSDIKQTISYHISNLVNFTKWTMNEMQMIFPIYLFPIDSHDSGPGAAVPSLAAHLS